MEIFVNCKWIVDIELINKITGEKGGVQIEFEASDGKLYQLAFDSVRDIRCMIENACLDRAVNFSREEQVDSSILLVQNSAYLEYFKSQILGTCPTDGLKDYFIFDKVDTIIEVLAMDDPILTEVI